MQISASWILLTFLSIFIANFTMLASGEISRIDIFPISSEPYGTPYSHWIEKWWVRWFGMPINDHPGMNYTADRCSVYQDGPVWFLPDIREGLINYHCEVPAGKAILLPLSTAECDAGTSPDIQGDRSLKMCYSKSR